MDYAGKAKAFLNGESGATSIDYGLIVAGISATIIAAVKGIGTTLNTEFPSVSSHLGCPSDTWCSWLLWPAHFLPSTPSTSVVNTTQRFGGSHVPEPRIQPRIGIQAQTRSVVRSQLGR